VITFAIVWAARRIQLRVRRRQLLFLPLAGLIVAGLAIAFAELGHQTPYAVLFSGSRAMNPVVDQAQTLSIATLVLLFVCKGLAWSVSLGSFRGGPVFPAIFVGAVGGLLAAHLPGFPQGAAVATVMGATIVAMLRLPLAAVVIALVMTASAGAAVSPLIIVAVVVSYVLVDVLDERLPPPALDVANAEAGATDLQGAGR
jgi:H+/Cl- antiporter ClcA